MPIKDKQKAREYKRLWMAKRRQQQKGNVEPVEPNKLVEPQNVEPSPKVEPENVESLKSVEPVEPSPCSRCPELETQIKELQNPINPTIELWKKRYFDLEKEYHKKGNEQSETINRLKEKLREQTTKYQSPNTNITQQENQANYQQIPKKSNITSLFYDKNHKKFVLHDCPDSCWTGKYCNNCSVFC